MSDALFDVDEFPSLAAAAADNEELRRRKAEYDAMGQDARRTVRNNRLLAAGTHPTTKRTLLGSLSDDEKALRVLSGINIDATCGDCRHCVSEHYHTRSYIKCKAVVQTHGPGSDTRKKWPACTRFEPR